MPTHAPHTCTPTRPYFPQETGHPFQKTLFSTPGGGRYAPRGRSESRSSCLGNPWTLTQNRFRKKRRHLKPKSEIPETSFKAMVENAIADRALPFVPSHPRLRLERDPGHSVHGRQANLSVALAIRKRYRRPSKPCLL